MCSPCAGRAVTHQRAADREHRADAVVPPGHETCCPSPVPRTLTPPKDPQESHSITTQCTFGPNPVSLKLETCDVSKRVPSYPSTRLAKAALPQPPAKTRGPWATAALTSQGHTCPRPRSVRPRSSAGHGAPVHCPPWLSAFLFTAIRSAKALGSMPISVAQQPKQEPRALGTNALTKPRWPCPAQQGAPASCSRPRRPLSALFLGPPGAS